MSRKRVILASGSRLLREMLQRVIDKSDRLEVVLKLSRYEELPYAIERFEPEWVILSVPKKKIGQAWINACIARHPSVRFVFLSPRSNTIKLKWQTEYEEDLTNLSLKGFIGILEKDLQHTGSSKESLEAP
jgi:hypothetical protein